jgi:hypothetical protein
MVYNLGDACASVILGNLLVALILFGKIAPSL